MNPILSDCNKKYLHFRSKPWHGNPYFVYVIGLHAVQFRNYSVGESTSEDSQNGRCRTEVESSLAVRGPITKNCIASQLIEHYQQHTIVSATAFQIPVQRAVHDSQTFWFVIFTFEFK